MSSWAWISSPLVLCFDDPEMHPASATSCITSAIILSHDRKILRALYLYIHLHLSSFHNEMSSPDMRIQHKTEKTEMTHNNSWSFRGSKGGSNMRILAIPAVAPCIKINKEKIVICSLYCLCGSAVPWEVHFGDIFDCGHVCPSLSSCTQTACFT